MVFSIIIIFFPPIIKIEVRRYLGNEENAENTHEQREFLRCWSKLKSRVGLIRPVRRELSLAGPDRWEGVLRFEPHTRWRCDAACPRNKFTIGVIFVSVAIRTTCLLNMVASIIDSAVLCLFSPSLPLSHLNNGSFVRWSIIIPASTLLSATRVRLVEADLSLEAIKESTEKGY